MPDSTQDAQDEARASKLMMSVAATPAVLATALTGSRANQTAGPLSDWDFAVYAEDVSEAIAAIQSSIRRFGPLRPHWDPLSSIWNYIFLLPPCQMINLLFVDHTHEPEPPWSPERDNLLSIDTHFWDWIYWLRGKEAKGQHKLVRRELERMYRHLLAPMGAAILPSNLGDAIGSYREARTLREDEFGANVDRSFESAIVRCMNRV